MRDSAQSLDTCPVAWEDWSVGRRSGRGSFLEEAGLELGFEEAEERRPVENQVVEQKALHGEGSEEQVGG